MKGILLGILFFIFGAVLIWGVIDHAGGEAIKRSLFALNLWGIIPILVLTALAGAVANLRWQIIFRARGIDVPFFKLLPIWLLGNAISYVTPIVYVGGEGVKGYLLKDKFNISWSKSAAIIALDKIFEGTATFFILLGGVALFVFYLGLPAITSTILAAISAILFLVISISFFYVRAFRNHKTITPLLRLLHLSHTRLGSLFAEAEIEMIAFLDLRSKFVWMALALSFLRQLFYWSRVAAVIYFLTNGINFSASLVSLSGIYLSFILPVPGALGVQEISQYILFSVISYGAEIGTALSFVLRGADSIMVAVGLFFLFQFGFVLIASKILRKMNINNHV